MVQTQVTAQGWLGSTPEGRRPQIRGWRAGASLAVASSTPATPLLSPAKIRALNHAGIGKSSSPILPPHGRSTTNATPIVLNGRGRIKRCDDGLQNMLDEFRTLLMAGDTGGLRLWAYDR